MRTSNFLYRLKDRKENQNSDYDNYNTYLQFGFQQLYCIPVFWVRSYNANSRNKKKKNEVNINFSPNQ